MTTFIKVDDAVPGTKVMADGGFGCIEKGEVRTIQKDDEGCYIECTMGKHYLDGQIGEDDTLVGLIAVKS